MVAALAEHGRYLHAFGDAGNSNWRSMQYSGLGTTALAMPELNNAAAWYAHAGGKIMQDMQDGVYPDGVEDEETSHYHGVALSSFDGFYQMTQEAGVAPDPRMAKILAGMFNCESSHFRHSPLLEAVSLRRLVLQSVKKALPACCLPVVPP